MDFLKEALGKHSTGWLAVIVILLMVGPAGIQRMFDRIMPPPPSSAALRMADDLAALEGRDKKIDTMIANQDLLMESLRRISLGVEQGKIERNEITRRLEELERFKDSLKDSMDRLSPSYPF